MLQIKALFSLSSLFSWVLGWLPEMLSEEFWLSLLRDLQVLGSVNSSFLSDTRITLFRTTFDVLDFVFRTWCPLHSSLSNF